MTDPTTETSSPLPAPLPAPADQAELVRLVERSAVLLMLALLLYGVLQVLEPFAVAIMFGGFIAIGTWALRDALVQRGVPRPAAAGIMLLALVLLVALPALALAPGLAKQMREGVRLGRKALAEIPDAPPAWVSHLPLVGGDADRVWPQLRAAQGNLRDLLEPYAASISETLLALTGSVVGSLVQILLALVVATGFWVSGDRITAYLRDVATRLGGHTAVAALAAAAGAVRGVAWGVIGAAMVQGLLLGIGLRIAGVPGAATLGFLGFVCAVSQVLFPLLIVTWAGAAWWLYAFMGETGWAVFMVIWGVVMVSGSDNIVRPLLISRGSTMPLTLIILGVFGGLIAFGFLGLFVGPALLAVANALMQAWRAPRAGPMGPAVAAEAAREAVEEATGV